MVVQSAVAGRCTLRSATCVNFLGIVYSKINSKNNVIRFCAQVTLRLQGAWLEQRLGISFDVGSFEKLIKIYMNTFSV